MSNWIRINKERTNLPAPYSCVIVSMNGGRGVNVGYFDGDHKFYDSRDNDIDSHVLGWMPEPKEMKEIEENENVEEKLFTYKEMFQVFQSFCDDNLDEEFFKDWLKS